MQNVELNAIEILFDELSDVAFFVKDRDGRYLAANRTLVRRCGLRTKQEIVGKTVLEVHPRHLAQTYMAQDREVIEAGHTINKHLELHLYPNRRHGWCLTHKTPLRNDAGAIVGLVGTSHDLGLADDLHPVYRQIASIAQHIRDHYREPLCLNQLAQDAGLPLARVERLFQRVFHYSPRQLLLQSRLDGALALIEADPARSIADIANDCGYSDHSAFSRQFKALTGMTPMQYRAQQHGERPQAPASMASWAEQRA
ncbi:AraC family transcriptional regulator [Rugamonas aquatica]|uniref:PAS domain-containing protein n=1 Tax=Rugamonas aquatica TaxID=2743357 RepID=A0A6A7MXD4_9BURK|nr:AraC family transcriptional regulator [Rugamonas aquatica]MQA37413.1 PAS domain-containing protein [Rugamonas aquatica]